MGRYLQYINDTELEKYVREVVNVALEARKEREKKLYSNVIDPFSAVFDAATQRISLVEWLEQEKSRQTQKKLQNAVGEFHPKVLGSIKGWEYLGKGKILDVQNQKRKIAAEVKNKYNTTKGNHRVKIYDDLKKYINKAENKGFLGYYVEIIPKNKRVYDKPYTPPDNVTKRRRPKNNRIRIIDGKSFYRFATGRKNALEELYKALPEVLGKILKIKPEKIRKDKMFDELFRRAY